MSIPDDSVHTTPDTVNDVSIRDTERREANIIGAVFATSGLVIAVVCALAYRDIIDLQSRYTVPGILLTIGATAVIAGCIGLVHGRRR